MTPNDKEVLDRIFYYNKLDLKFKEEFVVAGFLSTYTGLFTSFEDAIKQMEIIKKFPAASKYFKYLLDKNRIREKGDDLVDLLCDYANLMWRNRICKNPPSNKNCVKISQIGVSIMLGIYLYDKKFRYIQSVDGYNLENKAANQRG